MPNNVADRDAAICRAATSFRVHLFLGRGEYDRADAETPEAILALGEAMQAAHPDCRRLPMFYAIDPSRASSLISKPELEELIVIRTASPKTAEAKRAEKAAAEKTRRAKIKAAKAEAEAAKVKAEQKAAKAAAKRPKAAKPKNGAKAAPAGKRAEILAKAARGIIPPAPDFAADTHTRYRPALAEVVALVKAKDIDGLRAWAWKGFVGSSVKAILRYRDLALTALEAKAGATDRPGDHAAIYAKENGVDYATALVHTNTD